MSKPLESLEDGPGPARRVLGAWMLGPADDVSNAAARLAVGQMRAIWPIVIVGQGLAAAITLGATVVEVPAAFGRLAILALFGLVLAMAQESLLGLKSLKSLAPHVQVRFAVGISAALGCGMAMSLGEIAALASPPARMAGLFSMAVSAGLVAMALLPMRAAFVAFLATMCGGLALVSGSLPAVAATVAMLPPALTLGWRFASRDVRDRARLAQLESRRGLAARLVREFESHGSGWFWEADADGRLTYLSDTVRRIIEQPEHAAIGRPLTDVFRLGSDDQATGRTLSFHLSGRTSFSEYSVQGAHGAAGRWWSISGRPALDEGGRFCGFIGSGSDLTEKRRADAEIARLALCDGLTGLANRQRMRLMLDHALGRARAPDQRTALFLLDLDRFKAVNDTLGHQVGDTLLKLVAQRLQSSIGEAGVVGRLGGDEFQVVLTGDIDRDHLSLLAIAAISSLSSPYRINGATVSIGCSLGIAIAPEDGQDSETLIRNADLALYAAKGEGRGVHRFYREQLLVAAMGRRQLEDDLREACATGQFHLVYQPVVSTGDALIVGYEALLRWNHPVRGPISPANFIPIAEECGLIERIGEWVMRTACEAAAGWPENIRVAVNVSPIQFANPALPAVVTSALAQSGLTAGRLELEITEGVFLGEDRSTDRMFGSLKAIGVRLALDDFGTGYSSLGYLKQAPFDKIKIDQSFVRGAAIEGSRNAAIIRAIVALADTLGMETTAEGVEVQDEIELIRELGCSHIQGFVYGKPASNEEVLRQLGALGGQAEAAGFRTSRAPRMAMLRTAGIDIDGVRHVVRIRNITARGAMIDGVARAEPGTELLIEIFPGETLPACVQWARDNKAGIRFAKPIELDRLIAAADTMMRRVA